jgi:integrase/recombinase XerD
VPVLIIYRRHTKSCGHRVCHRNVCIVRERRVDGKPVKCNCRCPLWADGFHEGIEIRQSLRESNRGAARSALHRLTTDIRRMREQLQEKPTTIERATERYLADALDRNLHESTLYKYRSLFKQLKAFAETKGLLYVKQLNLELLRDFRQEWKDGPRSRLKKVERLRAWRAFCVDSKWTEENYARKLHEPHIVDRPTLPFTREEMLKILTAFEAYGKSAGLANAQRLKAFVLLRRYSGMRIGDGVKLSAEQLSGNRLFLYTQKTGVAVRCILPDFVVREPDRAPRSSERYFFWTGKSKLHSAIGKWQRRLQRLFKLAGVEGGHAHRFRDTFSTALLQAGVPLDRVSVLLGHRKVSVTEKHYAAWVRERQEQLETDLKRVWSEDPIAALEGTPEVHEESDRFN